jgi:hypothetical protein
MSIDRCQRCGDLVDTDDEPEAYIQIADMRKHEEWICLCRRHREEYEDERAEPSMPLNWEPSPEQLAVMDKMSAEHDAEETL